MHKLLELVSTFRRDQRGNLAMTIATCCFSWLHRFIGDRTANVAITFAIAMVPTVYLLGMALDYTQALRRQSQLDAATDAAVIAAIRPEMLQQSDTVAQATAAAIFNSTANNLGSALQSIPVPT